MKINKQIGNRGFTLVELMIVIVIIGVLAALASFGFIEYVKKSKSAEADEFVKKISDGAKVYYTSEQKCGGDETWHSGADCDGKGDGYPVLAEHKTFCGGPKVSIKTLAAPPKGGGKAKPDLSGNLSTWKCLNTSMADPTYFQYLYQTGVDPAATSTSTTSSNVVAVVSAQADFDSKGSAGDSASAVAKKAFDANQVLFKVLTVADGDVSMSPAILKNQGS